MTVGWGFGIFFEKQSSIVFGIGDWGLGIGLRAMAGCGKVHRGRFPASRRTQCALHYLL
jgi:hypothetical protein